MAVTEVEVERHGESEQRKCWFGIVGALKVEANRLMVGVGVIKFFESGGEAVG